MNSDIRGVTRTAGAMLVLAAAIACSPVEVAEADVRVQAADNGLSILNGRGASIYYFAIDRQAAAVALMLWAPCIDPETCDRVDPRASRQVASVDVLGWGASDEVILYWWHLVPAGAGRFRPDSIRSLIVPL